MLSIALFLLGLAVGSFLNSVIYRLEKRESALQGRSYCPSCKHTLSWHDLIPVLSFVFLQGKCRYCKAHISWQYPLVELGTAAVFLLIFASGEKSTIVDFSHYGYLFAIASLLIVIFVYDLKHYLIPDKILYPAIGLAFLWSVFEIWNFGNWDLFRISNFGFGILPALFFLAIFLVSRGQWMGFGDVKLALFMGLFLGWPNIVVALFAAFLLGAAIGVALIFTKKKTLTSQVPFGPFLIVGTFIGLFWGKIIVDWYLGLLV
ncbi:MAG: prepilin peptidase [Candidatus Wildermuthbacteria bacterium]|nr:prepilin peptidase [Candidatus Wildermuthbacteria bacterium]